MAAVLGRMSCTGRGGVRSSSVKSTCVMEMVSIASSRNGFASRLIRRNRLIEERSGTSWVCNEHFNVHHVGFFSGTLAADSLELGSRGCPLLMAGLVDGGAVPLTV
jgi:hypothetical protein